MVDTRCLILDPRCWALALFSVRGGAGAFYGFWFAAYFFYPKPLKGLSLRAWGDVVRCGGYPFRGQGCARAGFLRHWLDFGFWPMGFGIFSVFLCAFLRATLWLNLDPRCLRPQGVPIARESLISAPNNRSVIPIRQWPDRVPSVHHTSSSRAKCNGAWRSVCWAAPSL